MSIKKTVGSAAVSGVAGAAAAFAAKHVAENYDIKIEPKNKSAETKEEEKETEKVTEHKGDVKVDAGKHTEVHDPHHDVHHQNNVHQASHGTTKTDEPGEIEVIGSGKEIIAGHEVDVVYLSDGRVAYKVVDVDHDGKADAIFGDKNHDGNISEDEFIDLRGDGISMEELREQDPNYTKTGGEVEVIGIRTENIGGHDVDVLHFTDGQDEYMILDVERDGVADFIVSDQNHDGKITEDEIIDISERNLEMDDIAKTVDPNFQNANITIDEPDNNTIEVLSVDTEVMNGDVVEVAHVEVNGHEGYIIDQDNDDIADVIAVDLNDNGHVDEGEIEELAYGEISMAELRMAEPTEPGSLEVVDYQTVEGPNGEAADMVQISDGETDALLVDVGQDGEVDLLAIDSNHNGEFEQSEVEVVTGEGYEMPDAQDYSDPTGEAYLTQTGQDYINDADPDLYMA